LLITLWLALNLADSLLTYAILACGGEEIWLVYRLTNSMLWMTVAKWFGVVLVVLVLAKIDRLRWLVWFIIAMVPVVIWNLVCFNGN